MAYIGWRGEGWHLSGRTEGVGVLITHVLHSFVDQRFLLPAAIRAEAFTNSREMPSDASACAGVCYYDYLDCLLRGVLLVIRHFQAAVCAVRRRLYVGK